MSKEVEYKSTGFEKLDSMDLSINLSAILPEKFSHISVERIYYGNVNRNFKIVTDQNKYFCKIAPLWYEGSLCREAWALKKIKTLGCRVPEVLLYLDKRNDIIPGYEILLLEYVNGTLLADVANKEKYYAQIIRTYNSIHSISVEKYGWLDKNFVGENKTWVEFLLQIENEKSINSLGDVWMAGVNFVRDEIKKYPFGIYSGKLLYGDFNYYNFILNQDEVVVAFDFQNCFSGDPLYDVGMMVAKDIGFEKFLENFKTFNTVGKKDMRKRVFLYSLRYLLSMLSFYVSSQNEERILFAQKRFFEIKNLYEKY